MPVSSQKVKEETNITFVQGRPEKNIKGNDCVKKMRSDKVTQFVKILSAESDYCNRGGDQIIEKYKHKICEKSEALLSQLMNKAAIVNLSPYISECHKIKNYQASCVTNLFYKAFKAPIPEEYKKLVNKILVVRYQDTNKQRKK